MRPPRKKALLRNNQHYEVKTMENELKRSLNSVVRAEKECDIYCPICHKLLHVQAGDVIPRCCGKPMQVLD